MGRSGVPLSKEEVEKIKNLIESGLKPGLIADKLKRSRNSIYWHLREMGIRKEAGRKYVTLSGEAGDSCIGYVEMDLSSFPDNYFFKHENFQIP